MDFPVILKEYAGYKISIQNRSRKTVDQYCTDLALFFRYTVSSRAGKEPSGEDFEKIDISGCGAEFVRSISTEEIYAFLLYAASDRGNGARARARKLSSIKGFYKYMCVIRHEVEDNIAKDIEAPSIRPALPKYLSLEESRELLHAVKEDTKNPRRMRDYCIITLFLNCGMRLSELVGINISDIDRSLSYLRVLGKGSKERIIYLNEACRKALGEYMSVRSEERVIKDANALFISSRGTRMATNSVQHVVYKYLAAAGLEYKHYSVHKLRHTAATLMYQTGKVDVRVLKDILGHEQLSTTQIYTHVSDAQMARAMDENPLAKGEDDG